MSGPPPTALTHERWDALPLTNTGRVDKKRIKEIYDGSPHVEWTPFCQAMNWPAENLRARCPSRAWVSDKKRRIEERIAEELRELNGQQQTNWIKDVKQTLEQYPRAVDNVMVLAGNMMQQIAEDQKNKVLGKWKSGDILALAATVKTCVEAKKSILMLNDIVIKREEQLPQPTEGEVESGWTMSLKGEKDVTPRRLSELMLEYLDKPPAPAASEPSDAET